MGLVWSNVGVGIPIDGYRCVVESCEDFGTCTKRISKRSGALFLFESNESKDGWPGRLAKVGGLPRRPLIFSVHGPWAPARRIATKHQELAALFVISSTLRH